MAAAAQPLTSTAGSRALAVPESRTRAISWEGDHNATDGQPKLVALMSTPGKEKDKKIGHRRVDEAGQVTYKRKTTSELMAAIQLGIGQSVGRLAPKARRDVLYSDFHMVETVFYPSQGGPQTPAHHYSDFGFKAYAPIAFQYFRELFGIQTDDYLISVCNEPLRELSNPGASGSIFYITNDDEFIIKTVQHKEAEFLQKLLPGYYMNLNQNRATLLPKFYGLYCYQCGGKNIRFVVMNNLLPSSIRLHTKFDLKGSTYKRLASSRERMKSSPTYKDLDFNELYPEGVLLELDMWEALKKTIERDCRVLQSFKIMDYSFLLGIHNMDLAKKEFAATVQPSASAASVGSDQADGGDASRGPLMRTRSMRQRVAQYSTAMESIQADFVDGDESSEMPSGGIPARSPRGERLVLFVGIIDILQSYRLAKKFEHTFKAMVTDGDSISVHRPGFYAQRFQQYLAEVVFRKLPPALRHSPSKRKSFSERHKSLNDTGVRESDSTELADHENGAVGGQSDDLPANGTPIPPYTSQVDIPAAAGGNQPPFSSVQDVREPDDVLVHSSVAVATVESFTAEAVHGVVVAAAVVDSGLDLSRKNLNFDLDETASADVAAAAASPPPPSDIAVGTSDIDLVVEPDVVSSEMVVSELQSSSDDASAGYLASGSGDACDLSPQSQHQKPSLTDNADIVPDV